MNAAGWVALAGWGAFAVVAFLLLLAGAGNDNLRAKLAQARAERDTARKQLDLLRIATADPKVSDLQARLIEHARRRVEAATPIHDEPEPVTPETAADFWERDA